MYVCTAAWNSTSTRYPFPTLLPINSIATAAPSVRSSLNRPGGSEGHQLAEGLAEEFHLPVVEGVSQQQPVGYAPSYQGSEETFGLERLEVVGTYPEDGGKQHELRKKQAAQSDEDKGVEETACGPCLLVALEEEKQCHQEGGGCQVSRIQHVQAGADGYQQEVDRSLYRCPHPRVIISMMIITVMV